MTTSQPRSLLSMATLREVSRPTLDLQSRSYRPNELRTKWRFRIDQLAFVPGRSLGLT
jgi:hypothetical protein